MRVLDLADDRAIYAGKLLGASVLRLEPRGGDPLRERGPSHNGASLWHAFFAASRRIARAEFDLDAILALASCADIVIDCGRLRSASILHGNLFDGLDIRALVGQLCLSPRSNRGRRRGVGAAKRWV